VLRLSPTKIAVFEECPRRYKFLYLDGLGKFYKRVRPYFTLGENVHQALKEIYSLPAKLRTGEKLEELLHKIWATNHGGFSNPEEENMYKNRALQQIRWFAQNFDLKASPIMLEVVVREEISGLILEGRVDRVDREGKDSLHLIDYKTGNRPLSPDPRPLYLYSLALEQRQSMAHVAKVSYLYLQDQEAMSWEFGPEAFSSTLRWLLDVAYRISQETEYPPIQGRFCQSCDFREICPAHIHPKNSKNFWGPRKFKSQK